MKGLTVVLDGARVEPIVSSLSRPSAPKRAIPYAPQELWKLYNAVIVATGFHPTHGKMGSGVRAYVRQQTGERLVQTRPVASCGKYEDLKRRRSWSLSVSELTQARAPLAGPRQQIRSRELPKGACHRAVIERRRARPLHSSRSTG